MKLWCRAGGTLQSLDGPPRFLSSPQRPRTRSGPRPTSFFSPSLTSALIFFSLFKLCRENTPSPGAPSLLPSLLCSSGGEGAGRRSDQRPSAPPHGPEGKQDGSSLQIPSEAPVQPDRKLAISEIHQIFFQKCLHTHTHTRFFYRIQQQQSLCWSI